MFNIKNLKTDEQKEQEGAPMYLGDDGVLFVARFGNEKFSNYLRRKGRAYGRSIRAESIARPLLIKAVAKYILVGWTGLEDEDGSPLDYSKERAEELLTKYKDLLDEVIEFSRDKDNYLLEQKEEAAKN